MRYENAGALIEVIFVLQDVHDFPKIAGYSWIGISGSHSSGASLFREMEQLCGRRLHSWAAYSNYESFSEQVGRGKFSGDCK